MSLEQKEKNSSKISLNLIKAVSDNVESAITNINAEISNLDRKREELIKERMIHEDLLIVVKKHGKLNDN